MFENSEYYRISEVCDIVNNSKTVPRILYPCLLRGWVYTGKLDGRRQVGAHWYCRGSDLNKYLLPFLGIDEPKAVSSTVSQE